MPFVSQITLRAFDKWDVDFVGPINPPSKRTGPRYIITAIEYLTRWAKATSVKDCSVATTTHLLFEHVVTRFGCPRILKQALTKVCNAKRDDWYLRVPAILWAYRTTSKKLTKHTPSRLVY